MSNNSSNNLVCSCMVNNHILFRINVGRDNHIVNDISLAFIFEKIRLTQNASKRATDSFWDAFRTYANLPGEFLQMRRYRNMAKEQLPKLHTCALVENSVTKQEIYHNKVFELPPEKENECLRWVKTYVTLKEVLEFHNKAHRRLCQEKTVVFGTDGVSQSKSTTASLELFTIEFQSCKTVYPIAVVKVFPTSAKTKEDSRRNVAISKQLSNEVIAELAAELKASGMRVKMVKADAPKRSFLKNTLGHNSYFGCEYCNQRAKLFVSENNSSSRKSKKSKQVKKIVWPSREAGEPRTHEQMIQLGNSDVPPAERFGVKGPSILAEFEELDIIKDVPVESMHFLALGVIRSLISLAFGAGPKKSLYKIAKLDELFLNRSIAAVKLPSEFCRRSRPFDVACWKASEYRYFIYDQNQFQLYILSKYLNCIAGTCRCFISCLCMIAIDLSMLKKEDCGRCWDCFAVFIRCRITSSINGAMAAERQCSTMQRKK